MRRWDGGEGGFTDLLAVRRPWSEADQISCTLGYERHCFYEVSTNEVQILGFVNHSMIQS